MHQASKPNRGWQLRERTCLLDGVQVCSKLCMPLDDNGAHALDSKKLSRYPFISRIDRVQADRDLWPVINGKKTKIYVFETPYNPYWDATTERNSLHEEHLAMYQDCRAAGSFLSPDMDVPSSKDENGNWLTNWEKQHPKDYSADRKKRAAGEVMICTHQWRPCEENAQWIHEDENQEIVSGWSEWSQCFAQDDETQLMAKITFKSMSSSIHKFTHTVFVACNSVKN